MLKVRKGSWRILNEMGIYTNTLAYIIRLECCASLKSAHIAAKAAASKINGAATGEWVDGKILYHSHSGKEYTIEETGRAPVRINLYMPRDSSLAQEVQNEYIDYAVISS